MIFLRPDDILTPIKTIASMPEAGRLIAGGKCSVVWGITDMSILQTFVGTEEMCTLA